VKGLITFGSLELPFFRLTTLGPIKVIKVRAGVIQGEHKGFGVRLNHGLNPKFLPEAFIYLY
jgi:hypothetical protein